MRGHAKPGQRNAFLMDGPDCPRVSGKQRPAQTGNTLQRVLVVLVVLVVSSAYSYRYYSVTTRKGTGGKHSDFPVFSLINHQNHQIIRIYII